MTTMKSFPVTTTTGAGVPGNPPPPRPPKAKAATGASSSAGFLLQPLNERNESPLFRRRVEKLAEDGDVDR